MTDGHVLELDSTVPSHSGRQMQRHLVLIAEDTHEEHGRMKRRCLRDGSEVL